jgi:hypothetical protein
MIDFKLTTIITLFIMLGLSNFASAQNITFTFANATNTNDGANDYYEVDVMLSSDSDFKLGSGLLYFDYNTAAFGTNVKANSNIEFTYPAGSYILGEVNFLPIYGSYVSNDNTDSRVAFSWQQALGSGAYSADNATSTATALFHIKVKYADVNEDPSWCFPTNTVFHYQTYTACGPTTFAVSDCANEPGVQILTDNFDCSAASLPVELLYFTGEAQAEDVLLKWETASENNNSHFEIEHSTDGLEFVEIGSVRGAGTTTEQKYYDFLDEAPVTGENYYRLRQVDFDGNFEYSNIVVVVFGENDENTTDNSILQVVAFPNPTVNILNVKTEGGNIENIKIINSLGQVVFEQQNLTDKDLHQINVENLPSGTYYLQVNSGEKSILFIRG